MSRLLVALICLVTMSVFAATSAFAADSTWGTGGSTYTTSSGIGWHYSAEERAYFRTPASFVPESSGPPQEWSLVPTCDGNSPDGGDVVCAAALCTVADGDPGVTFWVFARPLASPDAGWTLTGSQCIPGEERVDLADVQAEIERIVEDRYRDIAQPAVTVVPADVGLVNLPMLAWTPDRGEVSLSITQPLPGDVRVSPSYQWQWSNGVVAAGPGKAYSPDYSPTQHADRYVSAIYRDTGQASVNLTVTWTGEVVVAGLPPVAVEPLTYTTPAAFDIREARAQLVADVD